MDNRTFKSLNKFVYDLVSEFDYSDYPAKVDRKALQKKFAEIFSKKNVFWRVYPTPDGWENSFIIQLETFNSWDPISIRFLFGDREITVSVFDEIIGCNFKNEFIKEDIELIKVWINQEELFNSLFNIMNRSFSHITRKNINDAFPVS